MNQYEIEIWYLFGQYIKQRMKDFQYYSIETIQDVRLVHLSFDPDGVHNQYSICNLLKHFNNEVIESKKNLIDLTDSSWSCVHFIDEMVLMDLSKNNDDCILYYGENKQLAVVHKVSDSQYEIVCNFDLENHR